MKGVSLQKYLILTPDDPQYVAVASNYSVSRNHIAVNRKDDRDVMVLPKTYVTFDSDGGKRVVRTTD